MDKRRKRWVWNTCRDIWSRAFVASQQRCSLSPRCWSMTIISERSTTRRLGSIALFTRSWLRKRDWRWTSGRVAKAWVGTSQVRPSQTLILCDVRSRISKRTLITSTRSSGRVWGIVPLHGFVPTLGWNPSSTWRINKISQNHLLLGCKGGRIDGRLDWRATTRQSPSRSWSRPMTRNLETEITLNSLKRWHFSLWFSHTWQKRSFVAS